MNDLTHETEALTSLDPQAVEETAVVERASETQLGDLAWSHEGDWSDFPTIAELPNRGLARWAIAVVALAATAGATMWLGSALYREHEAKAPPPPTVASTPAQPPVVPPEPPHGPSKYPYVALAVSPHERPNGMIFAATGLGLTQQQAAEMASSACRVNGDTDCAVKTWTKQGCVAVAAGPHGVYRAAAGATRSAATKAVWWPQARTPLSACSWDGDDVSPPPGASST